MSAEKMASSTSSSKSQSSSARITDTIYGSHDFKIIGYSLNKGLETGEHIVSQIFEVGGHSWQIRFYPNGDNEHKHPTMRRLCWADPNTYVSLFVSFVSSATDVVALCEIILMDQSGNGKHKILKTTVPYTFRRKGDIWGWSKCLTLTDLESSDYLKDDCLHVRCSIGVVRSRNEGRKVRSIPLPPSNFIQHFGMLLESGKETDINFEVDGENFAAHKLILAARSPVFNAQFFGPFKDQNVECAKIEDMKAPVFKALLHFIYWDVLPNLKEVTGDSTENLISLFQHLLAAADRYGLDHLVLLCADKLYDNLSVYTAATVLEVAERHNCLPLKYACLEFIGLPENLRVIRKGDAFKSFKETYPSVYNESLKELLEHERRNN